MANKQLGLPANRLFNNSNIAAPGGTASLYLSGTLTPANFLASDGVTPLGSTITANGLGQLPDAYGDETVPYRLILKDKNGVELSGGDIDPFYFGADSAAATSAAAAATSATNAATSATNAASSASSASTSATNAASSASAASTSATNAASSASAAATSETNAASSASSISGTIDAQAEMPQYIRLFRDHNGNVPVWADHGKLDAIGFGPTLLNDLTVTGMPLMGLRQPLKSDGRTWALPRNKMGTLRHGGTVGRLKLVLTGDSWFQRKQIPQEFSDQLVAQGLTVTSTGYVAFDSVVSSVDPVVTLGLLGSATVTQSGFTTRDISTAAADGSNVGSGGGLYSLAGLAYDCTTTGGTISVANVTGTEIRIYYKDANGTFRYRVDGGAWTTVTCANSGNTAKATIAGLTQGLHSFDIDTTGNAGTVTLYDAYVTSSAYGLELNQVGNGSSTAGQFSAALNLAAAQFILSDIAPGSVIVCLGTNDIPGNVAPSVYGAALGNIRDKYKAAGAAVALVFPPESGSPGSYPNSNYRDQVISLAKDGSCEFIDFLSLWAPYASISPMSWESARHLNGIAKTPFVTAIRNFLLPSE